MSDKPPVRVLLNRDGYVYMAGDPAHTDKGIKKEIMQCIEDGGTVKTIPFAEYETLPWIWDKKDVV